MAWEDDVRQLRSAGFSHEEIAMEGARVRRDLTAAGFSPNEIDQFFGNVPVAGTIPEDAAREFLVPLDPRALKAAPETDTRAAKTPMQMFEAGFDVSVSGLVGGAPDRFLSENPGIGERLLFAAGVFAGDLPAAVVGGAGGGVAGLKGGKKGAAIGAGAGSMALPEGIRRAYLDYYEKGAPDSARDFAERTGAVLWDAGKGGILGGASAGAGVLARGAAGGAGAGVAAQNTAQLTAEAAGMVAAQSALEGELPTKETIIDAGVQVVLMKSGMKAGSKVAAKLQKNTETQIVKTWAETGDTVENITADAITDPMVREKLMLNDRTLADPARKTITDDLGGEVTIVPMQKEQVAKLKGEGPEGQVKAFDPTGEASPQDVVEAAFVERDFGGDDFFSVAYTQLFDAQHPYNKMVDMMAGGDTVPSGQDVKIMMESTRFSAPRAEFFMRRGIPGRDLPGLDEIMLPLEPARRRDLSTLIKSLHAEELHQRGIENPVDRIAAQKEIGRLAKDKDLLKRARQFTEFNNAMLDEYADSGMLSKETVALWKERYTFYAPFLRAMDPQPMPGIGAGKSKRVFQVKKGQKGSENLILDPVESAVVQTYAGVRAADRNRAALALVELAEANPEAAAGWVEKKPLVFKKTEVTKGDIKAGAKDLPDEVARGAEVFSDLLDDETLSIWRAAQAQVGKNDMIVYRDGKPEIYTIDPEVAKFIGGLEAPDLGLVSKLLAVPNRVLKGGITLSPEFPVVQFLRDNPWEFIFNKDTKFPFESFVVGTLEMFNDTPGYKEWQQKGGAIATIRNIGDQYSIDRKDFLTRYNTKTGLMATARNVVTSPLQVLRAWADYFAIAPRVGAFVLAKRRGKSDLQALQKTRRSQIDFTRQGSVARELNRFIPFFSPALQALDQMVRSTVANPATTMARGMALITAPVLFAWAQYREEEWYKEMPQWQKDQSVPIRIGDTTYLVPLPPGASVLFGGLPRRALEGFIDENPQAADGVVESIITSFTPAIQVSAFGPFVEHMTNFSFFRKRPLVPDSVKDALPEDQYNAYTSETAKLISRGVGDIPMIAGDGISPIVIENYVNGWFGSLGRNTLRIADNALRAAGVVKKPAPPPRLSDTPFFSRFVMRDGPGAASLQLFYDNLRKHRAVMRSIKLTQDRVGIEPNAPERLQELYVNHAQELTFLAKVSTQINDYRELVTLINANPDIPDEEKLRLTDSLYSSMTMLARSANDVYEEMGEALEEAE